MLEPLSMLPLARSRCARLVLVGDPKQLPPTLSSAAPGSRSLEATQACAVRASFRWLTGLQTSWRWGGGVCDCRYLLRYAHQ